MNDELLRNNIKLIALGIVALIIGVGFYAYFQSKQTDEAPDFNVTDIDGQPFTLSEFRDKKVVLIDFMSVTCPSCREEMPNLVKIHEKFGNSIEMISIDVQRSDTEEEIRDFMNEFNAKWRAARDTDNLIRKYNVKSIVRLVIVDKEGKITFSHEGVSGFRAIEKQVTAAREGTASGVKISTDVGLTALAVGAGIFAFFSPCAFPMLPGYMSFYMARSGHAERPGMVGDQSGGLLEGTDISWEFNGESDKRKQQAAAVRSGVKSGLATALGIVFFYLLIGLLVSISGELVRDYFNILEPAIGILLIIFGIFMVQNIPIFDHMKNAWAMFKWKYLGGGGGGDHAVDEFGYPVEDEPGIGARFGAATERLVSRVTGREFSFEKARKEGYFGLFMFGIGYGAASASCCFPLFLAIILAALDQGGAAQGFMIFLVYALSMALLMVAVTVALSMSRTKLVDWLRSNTGKIEVIGGISLQIVGLYLIWYTLNA